MDDSDSRISLVCHHQARGVFSEGAQGAPQPGSTSIYLLVSAFYLLTSLMTYTFSKTVATYDLLNIIIKLSMLEFGRNHGCYKMTALVRRST